MSKVLVAAAGACALIAGAAVAGNAAQESPSAPAAAPAAQVRITDPELAGLTADEDTATSAAPVATRQPRRALCARVPKAIARTQALEKRLAADASTKGSLAWLKAKADAAQAAHQTELATSLERRLAFRKELAQFLPHRLELLQTAQKTVCAPGARA